MKSQEYEEQDSLLDGYNQVLSYHLLEIKNKFPVSFLDLLIRDFKKTEKNRLSIGKLYLLLTSLSSHKLTIDARKQIAVRLDVLFILCDYIDDYFDGDGNYRLTDKELLINSLSLLFFTIEELNKLTKKFLENSQVFKFFLEALEGERLDFYSEITKKSTVKSYFSKMFKKSIPLIQLVCYVACPEKTIIWGKFAEYLSVGFQLQNDANDGINITKSDLRLFKETLPLIKAIEYAEKEENQKFLTIIENKQKDKISLNYLASYIKTCGAFEYTLITSNLYIEEAFAILKNNYNDAQQDIELIYNYLKGES